MKVLVACEFSGVVRDAFMRRGHDAISCDLLPTESPGPHYQGDVLDILGDGWDLMIAHPPCTYLTYSAEWAYGDGPYHQRVKPGTLVGAARRAAREEAVKFFMTLANAPVPKICIENPVGVMIKRWRKPDQYIQPWQYGHDASKKTGLWLKGLSLLQPTEHIEPRWVCCGEVLPDGVGKYGCPNCCGDHAALPRWGNQTNSGQNRETPGDDRWKRRSITWQGWADAMAEQWGK